MASAATGRMKGLADMFEVVMFGMVEQKKKEEERCRFGIQPGRKVSVLRGPDNFLTKLLRGCDTGLSGRVILPPTK